MWSKILVWRKWHFQMVEKVHEKMETLKEIQDSAKLFEVGVPDFKALKLCLHEARLLKNVWDHVDLMKHLIDEWTSSKWMGKESTLTIFMP